ncbi:hypothetical protein AALB47_23090 [Lachnospiraceae bacterium 54-11]
MDGLGDYDREKGFPKGGVSLKFSTHIMTQDRGRTFSLDAMDVNESNFVMTAGQVLKIFQQTKVIPEVDSYRYSKVAQLAAENGRVSYGYNPAAGTIFEALTTDIAKVQDKIGADIPLVITLSIMTANILFNNEKISKSINVTDFEKGDVQTQVKSINGVPILSVPSDRLKTEYVFYNGAGEEEKGGYETTENAKTINWIISAKEAPIAVSKQDKMRIFNPDSNINADAYKLDYRRYHDLWIPKNKFDGIWVNIKEAQ